MIFGTGIDMIEVDRVADKIGHPGFKEMVFSKKEIEYCEAMAKKSEHYAARFAAKEAFFKAMGTGWKSGMAFNEVEITNDEHGKPHMSFIGSTANFVTEMNLGKIHVSLSHIKSMASAIVIIESL